ncbi:enoyl-CoA hydratase/isomerase family protein [Sphingobium indicum]|uniref:Enoyl-CoA hydratase/isomerase family protein n=2 Tax=Sphingobium indicum TaxID=332055 RepID=A0A4Q4J6K5_9SPHN|nr:enoyl-CoA hydratase/isomerase family protein [Sphingobium indicum]
MASSLIVEERGAALHVTLNRPERLNAMDPALVQELRDLFVGLYWRHDLRVVVLTGAGRGFCAGLDIIDADRAAGDDVGEVLIGQRRISEIVIAMRRCPQPIVALLNGPASGGGFALALASDIRVATPALKMNAAFIRLGLSACDIGVSYFLPRMVGSSVAADYMLTGRFFDAEAALKHGLVSRVVAQEALAATGEDMVASLLHATPLGLRLTKEALNFAIDAPGLEAVVAMEDRNQALTAQGPDFAEGIAAFRERRVPRFAQ